MRPFDHTEVTVRCPHCGSDFKKTVARLRDGRRLYCLQCGEEFDYGGGYARLLVQAASERVGLAIEHLRGH
jgi:uncharacterized C2H2 Zn-finger protein